MVGRRSPAQYGSIGMLYWVTQHAETCTPVNTLITAVSLSRWGPLLPVLHTDPILSCPRSTGGVDHRCFNRYPVSQQHYSNEATHSMMCSPGTFHACVNVDGFTECPKEWPQMEWHPGILNSDLPDRLPSQQSSHKNTWHDISWRCSQPPKRIQLTRAVLWEPRART